MKTMTIAQLQAVDGGSWGSFFTGLGCGATVVGAVLCWASPDPITKVEAVSLTIGAISCVGGIAAA